MMQFDRIVIGKQAKEMGFVRDTFEKVCRLADILRFAESDNILSDVLALKGGTAINLTIFDLPRLSVDIDLDYSRDVSREEMLKEREIITDHINKYMIANGYVLSNKSKSYHALDSFVYEYFNAGGMKDNLKIEINYMLRCHILPVTRRKIYIPWLQQEMGILSVAPVEIFATKIVALLTRTAPRDLYDIHNMVKYGLFDESEQDMLRKCAVFYSAILSEKPPVEFAFDKISNVSLRRIRTDLYPVLKQGERFELDEVRREVRKYLAEFLIPTKMEQVFWGDFAEGCYRPEYVFKGEELQRIKTHPMAMWKCSPEANEDSGTIQ